MPDEPPRWLGFAIANSLFVVLVALSIALGIAVVYGLVRFVHWLGITERLCGMKR